MVAKAVTINSHVKLHAAGNIEYVLIRFISSAVSKTVTGFLMLVLVEAIDLFEI